MCSERLAKIGMDSILESGYVEELISDHPYSPFLVMQTTQRPDLVAASLIEGKVALLIDGSPIALAMPVTFWYAFIAMLMATVTMGTNLAQNYDLFYRSGCDGFCVFSAKRIGGNGQLFA